MPPYSPGPQPWQLEPPTAPRRLSATGSLDFAGRHLSARLRFVPATGPGGTGTAVEPHYLRGGRACSRPPGSPCGSPFLRSLRSSSRFAFRLPVPPLAALVLPVRLSAPRSSARTPRSDRVLLAGPPLRERRSAPPALVGASCAGYTFWSIGIREIPRFSTARGHFPPLFPRTIHSRAGGAPEKGSVQGPKAGPSSRSRVVNSATSLRRSFWGWWRGRPSSTSPARASSAGAPRSSLTRCSCRQSTVVMTPP